MAEPAPRDHMVEVASAACGLQAQVLTAGELGLGVRVAGVTRGDVEAALWERRSLVKTYGPRGTIHLLPANEIALWIAANQGARQYGNRPWYGDYGLDDETAEAVLVAMRAALKGRCLTRSELADSVSQRVGLWARPRLASTWADLIGLGFDAGILCFGPSRGAQVTFVRLDQWIGTPDPVEPREALTTVCRRYFRAYGPATPRDFAQWFAPRYLTASDARQLMESIGDEWEEVTVEGRRGWLLRGDPESYRIIDRPCVQLLPQYDCYLLGSRFGRDVTIPAASRERVRSYKNGRFEGAVGLPTLLIDGVVSGVWERKRRGISIEVQVQPFVTLTLDQRQRSEAAAERIGGFFEMPTILSISRPE